MLLSVMLLGLAPASATAITEVHTLPADAIGRMSAQLHGQFSSDAYVGNWWFDWGETTAYGNTLGSFGFNSGSYSPTLSLAETLDPDTEYHYRLVVRAETVSGTITYHYGEDQSFQTQPPAAPTIVGFPELVFRPTNLAVFRMRIEDGALATDWWIEYGLTPGLGSMTTPGVTGPTEQGLTVDAHLENLEPGRIYYFQAIASNALGFDASAVGSFATVVPPPPPPPRPPPPPPPPPVLKHLTLLKDMGGGVEASTGLYCNLAETSCAADVPLGKTVTLTALSNLGTRFQSWGGACSSFGPSSTCTLQMLSDATVEAHFSSAVAPFPPPWPGCVVPRLRGKTVEQARSALRRHRCVLGSVGHKYSRTLARGRVISQNRRVGTELPKQARVSVVVSRGTRSH